MAEFKWIQITLLMSLMLQFTAAVTELRRRNTVTVGGEVTLPCQSVMDDQVKCDGTTWLFRGSHDTGPVELVKQGRIVEKARGKSDRLSVTENCFLVIKKVTDEDVGRYTCRQFDQSDQQQGQNATFHLSVIPNKVTKHTKVRWEFIIVPVVLAALVTTAVAVIIWKRNASENIHR